MWIYLLFLQSHIHFQPSDWKCSYEFRKFHYSKAWITQYKNPCKFSIKLIYNLIDKQGQAKDFMQVLLKVLKLSNWVQVGFSENLHETCIPYSRLNKNYTNFVDLFWNFIFHSPLLDISAATDTEVLNCTSTPRRLINLTNFWKIEKFSN